MPIRVVVQFADSLSSLPESESMHLPIAAEFEAWAEVAYRSVSFSGEIVVRIVDEREGRELNRRWREKDAATNVLSFAGSDAGELVGDIVICAPIVEREASRDGKTSKAHWAHLFVHGLLHLLGYDHDTAEDAASMEAIEIAILKQLGFPDPYDIRDS